MKTLHTVPVPFRMMFVDEEHICPVCHDTDRGDDNIENEYYTPSFDEHHNCARQYLELNRPMVFCECDHCMDNSLFHYYPDGTYRHYDCDPCREGNHPTPETQ